MTAPADQDPIHPRSALISSPRSISCGGRRSGQPAASTTICTDNGANDTARDFTRAVEALASRHQRIRPYTPRRNGKVERNNRLLADEVLSARPYPSEQARREAIGVWVNHFNYHRPHTACGNQPPASRTPARDTNVTPSYT